MMALSTPSAFQTCPISEFLSSMSQSIPLVFKPVSVGFSVTLGLKAPGTLLPLYSFRAFTSFRAQFQSQILKEVHLILFPPLSPDPVYCLLSIDHICAPNSKIL